MPKNCYCCEPAKAVTFEQACTCCLPVGLEPEKKDFFQVQIAKAWGGTLSKLGPQSKKWCLDKWYLYQSHGNHGRKKKTPKGGETIRHMNLALT